MAPSPPPSPRPWPRTGYAIVPWDRALHPVDNPEAVRFFIECEKPDLFCHAAMGSPEWTGWAAQTCAAFRIPFLYISSVSVYAASQSGPFTPQDLPAPDDDYGRYKLDCERRVQAAHPGAHLVRIGWQIGSAPGGNQMIDYLDRTAKEHGRIEASTRWFPGCSFLPDTAASLVHILRPPPRPLSPRWQPRPEFLRNRHRPQPPPRPAMERAPRRRPRPKPPHARPARPRRPPLPPLPPGGIP
jgi:hypothetical protein